MGYYINPPDQTKEDFLRTYGVPVDSIPADFDYAGPSRPVCLVENPQFSAAGICFDARETKAFESTDTDTRHREWFLVSTIALSQFKYPGKPAAVSA